MTPVIVPATTALAAVPNGSLCVASPACGTPTTLLGGLAAVAEPERDLVLYTGLLLGAQPFVAAVEQGRLRYITSHVTSATRGLVDRGLAEFVTVRASHIGPMLRGWARERPLVALVRLAPPDSSDRASLGVSTAYSRLAVDIADVVIAELDPSMPFTLGDAVIDANRVDYWVESESRLPDYPEAQLDPISERIADHVIELVPKQPVLQVGIGSVPEAIVRRLDGAGKGPLRFLGMVADGVVDLAEAGHLDQRSRTQPPVVGVDLLGTSKLWAWADRNAELGMYGSERVHSPTAIAGLDRFTSINSAIEIDLSGQINAEMAAGRQVSGTGGSHDFVEVALSSTGGRSILALTSTTHGGSTSRIVPRLGADAVTTIPRTMADVVVTEHGVAQLRGATLRERAQALIAIADPRHRDWLDAELSHHIKQMEAG